MNAKEFDLIVQNQQDEIRRVLGQKANEYAFGDRLSNFKRAAAILQTTSEQALIGMWTKHIISILDMVDVLDVKAFSKETWDEKIGDAINYLILLKGLIYERQLPQPVNAEDSREELRRFNEMGQVLPQPMPNRCVSREVFKPEDRCGDNETKPDPGDRIQWPR